MDHASNLTGIEKQKLSIKAVEEISIRRLDKLMYNPNDPTQLATLAHLKVKDNTAILIEEKQEGELDTQEDVGVPLVKNGEMNADIKTVIVQSVEDLNDFNRIVVDLEWSFLDLLKAIKSDMKLEGNWRMKKQFNNEYIFHEELDSKLKSFPDFVEGGVRLQMEQGRSPTLAEIVVRVHIHKQADDIRSIYVSANATVLETRHAISEEFKIDETKYTLFKVDALEEPTYPIRRLKQELSKCGVASGDLLVLKNDSDLSADEKLTLHVHISISGQASD